MNTDRPKSGQPPTQRVNLEPGPKKRVLFVDDEPAILDGLRNVLRGQRKEWDMVFALGGQAGVAELEKARFDVIVTDMRMPVVDGAALLNKAKEQHPDAVRLVLSGQSDAQTALKSAFVAHQFLAKPCEPDRLSAVVKRSCDLQALLSNDTLRALAGVAGFLPPAPRTFMTLLKVLADPRSSLADAARVVERDPALCAKILQVVNSAFFGLPRRVSNVEIAANYLGSIALRNLALSIESMNNARSRIPAADVFQAYQYNVLLGALVARRFAASNRTLADDAFMAAMLRDMGSLLLASGAAPIPNLDYDDQAALGAYLLGLWGLPHPIMEAVAFHENPTVLEHESLELADVVHIADRIAARVSPSPFERAELPLYADHLERLGVNAAQLDELTEQAKSMLNEVREMLV